MQDNHRATIVGSTTFGKAVVQSRYTLSDGLGVAITTARYYPPNRADINQVGIIPDVEVAPAQSQQQNTVTEPSSQSTADDLQYQQALTALENTLLAETSEMAPS